MYKNNHQASSEMLTPSALANKLQLNEKTLANWRCTGKYRLPFIKVGNRVLYRQTDVDAWLESRTHLQTS